MADETRTPGATQRRASGTQRRASPERSDRGPRGRVPEGGRFARRRPQIFPPQEGLQVLHGEDRSDQLQGRSPAGRIRRGEREDRSTAPDRSVHAAPAAIVERDQAGPQYRVAAVCGTSAINSRSSLVVCHWSSQRVSGMEADLDRSLRHLDLRPTTTTNE